MDTTDKRRVLIVIPFGVPGSGKSFVMNGLKDAIAKERPDWTFEEISSDDMRRVQMDKLLKVSADMTKEEAFEKTIKTGPKIFAGQLAKMLKLSDSP